MSDSIGTTTDKFRKFLVLRARAKQAKDESVELGKQADRLQAGVIEQMDEDDLEKMTITEGASTGITYKMRASYLVEDKERALAWIRDLGHAHLIQDGIHHSVLSSLVEELMDAHDFELPTFIKTHTQAKLSVRLNGFDPLGEKS